MPKHGNVVVNFALKVVVVAFIIAGLIMLLNGGPEKPSRTPKTEEIPAKESVFKLDGHELQG